MNSSFPASQSISDKNTGRRFCILRTLDSNSEDEEKSESTEIESKHPRGKESKRGNEIDTKITGKPEIFSLARRGDCLRTHKPTNKSSRSFKTFTVSASKAENQS